MQATIIYFFFVSCTFARETSIPDPADNILDVKKLPSAEENPASNPDDDDIYDNVEDLQRELMAERIKNRDLNQTISDILERMEDMEKNIISNEGTISENQRNIDMVNVYVATLSDDVVTNEENIMRNEEKITDNQSSVFLLSRDVDDLQDDVEENSANITKVFEDVATVQDNVVVVAADVERNSVDITTLATTGTWCGYQDYWSPVGTINYDSLTFSASNNMNYAATPLDINTGINSLFFYYLDICHFSGIFTVPVSGAWRLTYSVASLVNSGETNYCYLYLNGDLLTETKHWTYSETGQVMSTGGRVVTVEASAGDKIEVRAYEMDGYYYQILYCAEYIPKM